MHGWRSQKKTIQAGLADLVDLGQLNLTSISMLSCSLKWATSNGYLVTGKQASSSGEDQFDSLLAMLQPNSQRNLIAMASNLLLFSRHT